MQSFEITQQSPMHSHQGVYESDLSPFLDHCKTMEAVSYRNSQPSKQPIQLLPKHEEIVTIRKPTTQYTNYLHNL